jgi:hypothetical protein
MDGAYATTTQPARAVGNLIVDITGSEYRVLAWRENLTRQKFFDSTLASALSLS